MIEINATPPIINSRLTELSEAKVAAPNIIIKEAKKKDK
jgi:hypothetical protein